MSDTIVLDNLPWAPPSEPASVPGFIKHVHCDGARFHVLHWALRSNGWDQWPEERCSEKNCITNHIADEACRKHGIKP